MLNFTCVIGKVQVCNCPTLRVKLSDFLLVVFMSVRFNRYFLFVFLLLMSDILQYFSTYASVLHIFYIPLQYII